jgi:SagB-type dehydrogenase family enzyme
MTLEAIERLLIDADRSALWELFHENSKTSFFEPHLLYKLWPSDETVVATMQQLHRVKPYGDFPKIALPAGKALPVVRRRFDDVIRRRQGARAFSGGSMRVHELAKILWMSYGVNRANAKTHFPRPFRMIPSGGALYPLELYVHASRVDGLDPGLYHYDPEAHNVDVLRQRDDSAEIAGLLIQPDLARAAAAVVFISAIFERSTFKYGDRGYRFVLLEAGHLAQNVNLVAQGLGLASVNIGGYNDRAVDRYLLCDGVNESVVYIALLGRPGKAAGGGHGV